MAENEEFRSILGLSGPRRFSDEPVPRPVNLEELRAYHRRELTEENADEVELLVSLHREWHDANGQILEEIAADLKRSRSELPREHGTDKIGSRLSRVAFLGSPKLTGMAVAATVAFAVLSGWLYMANNHHKLRLSDALATVDSINLQDAGQSEAQLRNALPIIGDAFGRTHPTYRHGLATLHSVLLGAGKPTEARQVAMELSSVGGTGGEFGGTGWLNAAANDAILAGDKAGAKEIWNEIAQSSVPRLRASAWYELSKMEAEENHYKKAIEFGERAIAIDAEDVLTAPRLTELASYYAHELQWDNVRETISKIIDLNSRRGMLVDPHAFDLLAFAAAHQNDWEAELAARIQAVDAIESRGFGRKSTYALLLTSLSQSYLKVGKINRSHSRSMAAVAEFERIKDTDDLQYGHALTLAAVTSNLQEDSSNAAQFSHRAIKVIEAAPRGDLRDRLLAWGLGELCKSQRSLENLDDAESAGKRGLQVANETRDLTLQSSLWLDLSAVALDQAEYAEAAIRAERAKTADPAFSVVTRQSLLGAGLAGQQKWQEAEAQLRIGLAQADHEDHHGILKFQLSKVLAEIPGNKDESDKLLAESTDVMNRIFPGVIDGVKPTPSVFFIAGLVVGESTSSPIKDVDTSKG